MSYYYSSLYNKRVLSAGLRRFLKKEVIRSYDHFQETKNILVNELY